MIKILFNTIFELQSRVWLVSILNVIAMGSQLIKIIRVKDARGISRIMLLIFLWAQITYAQVGFEQKIWGQFAGMTVSAILSSILLVLTFVLRPKSQQETIP